MSFLRQESDTKDTTFSEAYVKAADSCCARLFGFFRCATFRTRSFDSYTNPSYDAELEAWNPPLPTAPTLRQWLPMGVEK